MSAGPRHPLALRPQHEELHVARTQQPLRTHVTGAALPLTATTNGTAVLWPTSAAAGWDRRQAMPQAASKGTSSSRAAMPRPVSSAPVWALVKPSSAGVKLDPPTEKASLCVTPTLPTAARTISAVTTMSATPLGTTAAATVEKSPVMSHCPNQSPAANMDACPTSIDGAQDATFEQVHLLLASLNLPGIKASLGLGLDSPKRLEFNGDAPDQQQSGDLAIVKSSVGRVTDLTCSGVAIHPPPGHGAHIGGREAGAGSLTANGTAAEDLGPMPGASRNLGAAIRSVDVPCGHQPPTVNARTGTSQGPEIDNILWPFDRMFTARGSVGGEWFVEALRPACRAWLQSVARIAAQQRNAELHGMRELFQQIQEARLERRHLEAYLMGTRLGITRARLARLHELAMASGASPAVASTLLSQLEDRLRLKLGLKALRQNAAMRTRLHELLQSRQETGGPLAVAALQCWRRAAARRLMMRSRTDTMNAARRLLNARRVLFAWRATVLRACELQQLEMQLRKRLVPRRAVQCFLAWHAACQRCAAFRRVFNACRAARMGRLLRAWQDGARRHAHSGRLRRAAQQHYRLRLLLASLAHWRFLHVSHAVARVWDSALARRRELQLMARAMRVWHFYARRCRQLIRQLAGQRAAAALGAEQVVNESELPAPLSLAALPAITQRLLSTARSYMLAMSDEVLHLRSFLRFTSSPTWSQPPAGDVAVAQTRALTFKVLPIAGALSLGPGAPGQAGKHLAEIQRWAEGTGQEVESGVQAAGNRRAPLGQAGMRVRMLPRLLISGQWRHKRQVLVLLAQLRQVERMAVDVDAQLEAAERDGRILRLGLQQKADEIQRRTTASQYEMAAAREQQQAVQAELEQLNKEALAVGGYLDRCREVSIAAAEELRSVEAQLAEVEVQHREAQAVVTEAQAREASFRQSQMEKQAVAEAAARLPPHPSFARAQEAERQGRERLLAAQRRLSEALQLKAALMAHWREAQLTAASAPRYAAQRHALRVREAQQQVVEAAKVVSLAELEVQDLLTAVDRLKQATQDAKAADDELNVAADAANAQAMEATEKTTEAARETAQAEAAEQRMQGIMLALRMRVQELREAHAADLPQTPTRGQSVLLEPLRVREDLLKGKLKDIAEQAEAAHRELQAATAAAAVLSQQVETAEMSYRAQLLRLQPARTKLRRLAQQLRSRLEAFPAELVHQLRPLVDEHGIEASQDATGHWTVKNLPRDWARALRPGMLLTDAASDTDSGLCPGLQDGNGSVSTGAHGSRHSDNDLRHSFTFYRSPRSARSDNAFRGFQLSPFRRSPVAAVAPSAGPVMTAACKDMEVARAAGQSQLAPNASATDASPQQPHLKQQRHQQFPQCQNLDLHGMSAAQLSRLARSLLGSPANRSLDVHLDPSLKHNTSDSLPVIAPACTGLMEGVSGQDGPSLGVLLPEAVRVKDAGAPQLRASQDESGVGGAPVQIPHSNLSQSTPHAGERCCCNEQQQQPVCGPSGSSAASRGHSSSNPRCVASRSASVSPETRHLISLLERALGHELDATRPFRVDGSSTAGGDGVDENCVGAITGPRFTSSSTPLLGTRGELLECRAKCHQESTHVRRHQQASVPPQPSDDQLPEFWEPGYGRQPTRAPVLTDSGDVGDAAPKQLSSSGDGSTTFSDDGRPTEVLVPLLAGESNTVLGATERARGRFSSASSLYAHFSNPISCSAQGRASLSDLEKLNPKPQHEHLLKLADQLAVGEGGGNSTAPTPDLDLDVSAVTGGAGTWSTLRPLSPEELVNTRTGFQRGLDDIAWWFNRRRLCLRVLQGFRQYTVQLGCVSMRLQCIARVARLRWVLSHWRSVITAAQAVTESEANTATRRRYLRCWRSYVRRKRQRVVMLEVGRQRVRNCKLRASFARWHIWRDYQIEKCIAAASANKLRMRWLLLRWLRGAQIVQGRRARTAIAEKFHAQAVYRCCLNQWLRVCRARQLLLRVLTRAEMLWEDYPKPSTHFGDEFGTLRHAFDQLLHYRAYRLDKRSQRINEQAAVAFRTSLLRVRAFAAWQAAVELAWRERYVKRLAVRSLRSWRLLARKQCEYPKSLCNLRRRLRLKGYAAGEADVRCRWLLRCTLKGLRAQSKESYRHYTWSLMSRALGSWRLVVAETTCLINEHRRRSLAMLLQHWHSIALRCAHLRLAYAAFVARRYRRLLRNSLAAWAKFVGEIHAKGYLLSAAALHYEHTLSRQVLRCLSGYVSRIRCGLARAVAHDARRRLRRCVAEWRAHAFSTRAKTDMLMRTLLSVDTHHRACDHLRGHRGPLPAGITDALLPTDAHPARHRANCAVTAAQVKTGATATNEQVLTPSSFTLSEINMPHCHYRMEEVQVPGGGMAQILALEPRLQKGRAESTGCAIHMPNICHVWKRHINSSVDLEAETFSFSKDTSPPSDVALQDLPSDVSSMDATTLNMWRRYAEEQLAKGWWRRQTLRRVVASWRKYTGMFSFLKRWKSQTYAGRR
ncbi:hypothetical protein Vretifemale_2545, partial [Volvox reticuliferus]